MKPSIFILLLVSTSAYAQLDSIVLVRKPVLQCLIAGHYTSVKLSEENSLLRNQQVELKNQLSLYKEVVSSHRKDSVLCDSLITLNKSIAKTWQESYEAEKMGHKQTKKEIKKWKGIAILAVLANIVFGVIN